MPSRPTRLRVAAWACLVAGFAGAALAATRADPPPAAPPAAVAPSGFLISVDADGRVQVVPKGPEDVEKDPPTKGLLVWGEDDLVERWEAVKPGWKRPKPLQLGAAPAAPGDQ